MEESKKIINTGLRGVTVASTRIRAVDGEAGKLIYRGYPIFDLSDKTSCAEIVHLLLYESLPDEQQLNDLKEKKSIDIYPNVDFYSAPRDHYMGIPADLFTPIFAISRIAGWAAHVIEEQFGDADAKPVLYRRASDYIGEYCGPAECSFVAMDKR